MLTGWFGDASHTAGGTPSRVRALLFVSLAVLVLAGVRSTNARAEEATARLTEQQRQELLYATVVVGGLSAPEAPETAEPLPHGEGTMRLLETELIVKLNEPVLLSDAQAEEVQTLFASVHQVNSGESLSAAIEDLDGLVQELDLGGRELTPIKHKLQLASKSLGRQLLEEVQHAAPPIKSLPATATGLEPFATTHLWWGNDPAAGTDPYTATRAAFHLSEGHAKLEGLLASVTGQHDTSISGLLKKIPTGAVGGILSGLAGKLAGGQPVSAGTLKSDGEASATLVVAAAKEAAKDWEEGVSRAALKPVAEKIAVLTETRSFSALVAGAAGFSRLEVAASLAASKLAQTTADIASEAVSSLASLADPVLAVQLLSNAPAVITQIVNLLDDEPSPEAQILEQLKHIEEMIKELSNQVSAGLAGVDERLAVLNQELRVVATNVETIEKQASELGKADVEIGEKIDRLESAVFTSAATSESSTFNEELLNNLRYGERHPGAHLEKESFNHAEGAFLNRAVSEAFSENFEPLSLEPGAPGTGTNLDGSLAWLAAWSNHNKWGEGVVLDGQLFNPALWAEGAEAYSDLFLENPGLEWTNDEKEQIPAYGEAQEDRLRQLREQGEGLVSELGKISQHTTPYAPTTVEFLPGSTTTIQTGSNVLDHAVANYLTGNDILSVALTNEEDAFLSKQDNGGTQDGNCKECKLGVQQSTETPASAQIEPWGNAEQTPNQDLTPMEPESTGQEPEEGNVKTVGDINACTTGQEEEGVRAPRFSRGDFEEPTAIQPGRLALDKEVDWGGSRRANPLLTPPLPNALENAWHLGLGRLTACYVADSAAPDSPPYERFFQYQIDYNWYDNQSASEHFLYSIGLQEPAGPADKCFIEDGDARLQALWTKQTAEGHGCSASHSSYYEEDLAAELATLGPEGLKQRNAEGNFTILGSPAGGGEAANWKGWWDSVGYRYLDEFIEPPDYEVAVASKVAAELTALQSGIAKWLVKELSTTGELYTARNNLDKAYGVLTDFIDLALPVSAANDSSLGAAIQQLLEESRIEHALEGGANPGTVVGINVLRALGLGRLLSEDLAADNGTLQVDDPNQLVPTTDARLALTEFVLHAPAHVTTPETPNITITAPVEGGEYEQYSNEDGDLASFSCSDPGGGAIESCDGTEANGSYFTFQEPGTHEFTVTAHGEDGGVSHRTVKFTVAAYKRPTIITRAPRPGSEYYAGENVGPAEFECKAVPGDTLAECYADYHPVPWIEHLADPGEYLVSGEVGMHLFEVFAEDQGEGCVECGRNNYVAIPYNVVPAQPPNITLRSPTEGEVISQGASMKAQFECAMPLATARLQPGAEGCEGTTANGAALDTSVPGRHEVTVTARGEDGLSATKSVAYVVQALAPVVSGVAPHSGVTGGGTTVKISGSGFREVESVTFGLTPASGFEVLSESTIEATAPPGVPGAVDVAVTTPGGTSAFGTQDRFTYFIPRGAPEDLPEVGRCIKLKSATGVFANAGCTTRSEAEDSGLYEWEPGPGVQPSFLFRNNGAALTAVGKGRVTCAENTYEGEFVGSKTIELSLSLSGCEPVSHLGIKCESAGAAAGEVNTSNLEGHLGFIKDGAHPTVGFVLTPAGGASSLTTMHCGEEPITITGGFIGAYSAVNRMQSQFTVAFAGDHGRQVPQALEGGSDELLEMALGEGPPESVAFLARDKATNREWLEIKASP